MSHSCCYHRNAHLPPMPVCQIRAFAVSKTPLISIYWLMLTLSWAKRFCLMSQSERVRSYKRLVKEVPDAIGTSRLLKSKLVVIRLLQLQKCRLILSAWWSGGLLSPASHAVELERNDTSKKRALPNTFFIAMPKQLELGEGMSAGLIPSDNKLNRVL